MGNAYQAIQNTLNARAAELRDIHDHPAKPAKGVSYSKIPGLVLKRHGRLIEDSDRVNCELMCTNSANCKSYSFSVSTAECIWSTDHFQYSPDSAFYVRKRALNGDMSMDYRLVPGLKVHVVDPEKQTQYSTVQECKYQCSSSLTCTGFGFNSKTDVCSETGPGYLEFSPGYDYYEKMVTLANPKEGPPHAEIAEGSSKQTVFEHSVDVMKKVHAEQNSKAFTNREYLRKRTIVAEAKVKRLEGEKIQTSNRYEAISIKEEALTQTVVADTARVKLLTKDRVDMKKVLTSKKASMAVSNSKESREKYLVDINFLTKKLVSAKKETKVLVGGLRMSKPSERTIKVKIETEGAIFRKTEKEYHDGMFSVRYDEARVNAAAKEKLTKQARDAYYAAKKAMYTVTQEKPIKADKVKAAEENLLNTRIMSEATANLQKKYTKIVLRLRQKNQAKFDKQQKMVKEMSKKRTETITKEEAAKAFEKRQSDERAKKRAVVEKKEKVHAKEQAIKDKRAAILREAEMKKEIFNEKSMKREAHSKKEAKKKKKNLKRDFQNMRSYENAVEVADEQEAKAKQKNKLAKDELEKEEKAEKEQAEKAKAAIDGSAKVILAKRKAEMDAQEKDVKHSLNLVKEQRAKKADSDCNTICETSGAEKETLPVPMFLGCYKDSNETRALKDMHILFETNSKEVCNMKCLNTHPTNMIFGLQGRKCFCGKGDANYQMYGKAEEKNCIIPCPGAPKQACGGPYVNRLYQLLIPRGTFDWTGAKISPKKPPNPDLKQFKRDGCQCTGHMKPHEIEEEASVMNELW